MEQEPSGYKETKLLEALTFQPLRKWDGQQSTRSHDLGVRVDPR